MSGTQMLECENVMANKELFKSHRGPIVPPTNAVNEAGGKAYKFDDKHHLAQLAATGCLNNTFYVTGEQQLEKVIELALKVEPEFVAKVALYAREKGFMKDMPALLCAVLAARDVKLLKQVFPRVIDNGKMLRNFAQIVRSGVVGRKSFGTAVKKLIQSWINNRRPDQLFRDSVGDKPSLADVIKMVHPKPGSEMQAAFYSYLIGSKKGFNVEKLPELVQQYETFKKTKEGPVPNVEFRLLTALDLGTKEWISIALTAPWTMTRMNLNTFARHGVFKDPTMVKLVAARLRDPELVKKSRCFPYQLLTAFLNVDDTVPSQITLALQDAMELATQNVPKFEGNVFVFPDVSGSMASPVTGNRPGSTTKTRCIDIAALVSACVLRQNPDARIIPFEGDIVSARKMPKLNPRDSVMTNAQKLASIGGGSTNCSAPLRQLNREAARADVVIYVSDNESWRDSSYGNISGTMAEWAELVGRKGNENAKLVCIDITPNGTTQGPDGRNRLNIGGFSDSVFEVVSSFLESKDGHWTDVIEKISLVSGPDVRA